MLAFNFETLTNWHNHCQLYFRFPIALFVIWYFDRNDDLFGRMQQIDVDLQRGRIAVWNAAYEAFRYYGFSGSGLGRFAMRLFRSLIAQLSCGWDMERACGVTCSQNLVGLASWQSWLPLSNYS